MGRRKKGRIHISVRVDEELYQEIQLLLHDPTKGRTRYGALSDLVEAQLRAWLERRKTRQLSLEEL
jgi:Arc/MetJ-type ribon-helix-helix transcriptional regulator